MKRIIVILNVMLLLNACTEEFDRQSVDVTVHVTYNKQFSSKNVAGIPVTLSHQLKSVQLSGITDEQGNVTFVNLDPGFYSAHTSLSISADKAGQLSGQSYNDSLVLNGNKLLTALESIFDTIFVIPAFNNPLIIREFYYSGSETLNEKMYYADQYIDVYNNSNLPQNINGLIISTHASSGTGFNIWSDIKDSVAVNLLWQIPPDTQDSILAPGKSIVIATDAINHRSDPNANRNSPVDLAEADYEFYMENEDQKDLDAPAKNLKEIYTMDRGSDIVFNTRIGGGLMLIRAETEDMNSYMLYHRKKKWNVAGTSFKYVITIPNKWVVDAIDVLKNSYSEAYKRFPPSLDAGFTYNDDSKSGLCISRKLASDAEGRKVFMDTNNSTVDFLNNQIPNPFLND